MIVEFLFIFLLSCIIATFAVFILKKVVKGALFIGLVIIIFVAVAGYVYPELNVIDNGKSYILENSERLYEDGRDKVTAFVIAEANNTISDVKSTAKSVFD